MYRSNQNGGDRARILSPNHKSFRPSTAAVGGAASRIYKNKTGNNLPGNPAKLSAYDRLEKIQMKIAIRDSKRENEFANSGAGAPPGSRNFTRGPSQYNTA